MSRRYTGFPPGVRDMIEARAGIHEGDTVWVRCEGCGRWCAKGEYDLQHRVPRGRGGTRREWVNQAANGMVLCRPDHSWAETNRLAAVEKGWLISQHRKDVTPTEVPVLLWDGWCLLDDQGDKWSIPEPAGVAS